MPPKSNSVPERTHPEGPGHDYWRKQSVVHMAAVIDGRGEGKDINNVADALQRCSYLKRLVEAHTFQPVAKGIATDVFAKLQSHWTARHSVHVWDRLELSRSQMETLYHLLSFVYDPVIDKYKRV